jgi:hypothetical protein
MKELFKKVEATGIITRNKDSRLSDFKRSLTLYEKIIFPLDGSKRAESIRPHLRELAIKFQATVILLMVIEHTLYRW